MVTDDIWRSRLESLGAFIRSQRRLANLSLRDMAELTHVSNPYLSQIERGLHEPSVRVLRSIAKALNLSAETLLSQAGVLEGEEQDQHVGGNGDGPRTETATPRDPGLTEGPKEAPPAVYRDYRAA